MTAYYVEVNECAVFATQRGADFWLTHYPRFQASGKLETVKIGPMGSIVRISCADQEEAEFMRGHMVDVGGMPKSAVKVRSTRQPPGKATP